MEENLVINETTLDLYANKMTELEEKIKVLKIAEKEYDKFKKDMFNAMTELDIKTYESINGTKFTRVDATPEKTQITRKLDEEKLKTDYPDLYVKYMFSCETIVKGRAGYCKITLPKESE